MEDHCYHVAEEKVKERQLTSPERRKHEEAKRSRDRRRQKTRINIGAAFPRWKSLMRDRCLHSDAEVASLLLNSYERGPSTWTSVKRKPGPAGSSIGACAGTDRDENQNVIVEAAEVQSLEQRPTGCAVRRSASLSSKRTVVDAELRVCVYVPAGSLCSQRRRKMCAVQLLRVSVHERISAAAEDFLLQVEKGEEAAEIPALRALLTERLTAAAEEIVGLLEETVAEYEDRVERSEREICRQRRLLDAVLKPEVKLHRAVCPADVQLLLASKDEDPPEQQDWRSSLDQEDPAEPPHIKEEEEELWTSPEEDQLRGLEEADITKFTFTPVPVKSEEEDDDEEKPPSSLLHQRQTEEKREAEPSASSSAEQMETEADGEDCGGPDPERHLEPVSEDNSVDSTETDDSDCDWTQANKTQSHTDSQKNSEAPDSDVGSSGKERPFPCSYCGKRFSLKGNLNRHIRDHTGERPFPCTGCDKSFKDSGSLTAHMRCHTGEQPYSCLFCGKNFSGRGNMTRHMRIHTGEKPFTCSVCSKSFHVKEHLNRHMKYHTGEKPFSCTVCGKGCAQKTDLKKHMRVHTGEKPFSCPFCGKCCAEKGDLTKHMRVHTGEKPFSCNVCGKSCAQKGSLKIHMRVHTGEKPFSCSVCGKCFTVTGHLKRHMKLHTADSQVAEPADTYSAKVQREVSTVEPLNTSVQISPPHTWSRLVTPGHAWWSGLCGDWTEIVPALELPYRPSFCSLGPSGAQRRRKMCAVQLLRVSVHERISAAAEDFLLQVEKGEEAAEIPALRALLTERLTAAAEEIVGLLEETVAEYEDRVERSEREICRQRRLLDAVLKPEVKLYRADVQLLSASQDEDPPEQQDWRSSLDQEDPAEPPHIKEEQEELWTSQEGEQLGGLEEADVTKVTFTPVPVKSEEEDEEKPPSSLLHQRQTEENRDCVEAEDCGGPEPAIICNPESHLQADVDYKTSEFSVAEIEVSCDDWEESREPRSGLNPLKNKEDAVSDQRCDSQEKPFSCSECGKKFTKNRFLETHMRRHTGEKPLSCSVCGKKYTIYRYLIQHMSVHSGDRRHSCSICNKRLVWHSGVERHHCDRSECDKRLCYSHRLKDGGAHPEDSLFSCSVCGRKFTQRGYLIQHMARHTGKIRFRCCVCDRRFAWRHELKSHECVGDSSHLDQSRTEGGGRSAEHVETAAGSEDRGGSDSDDKTSDSSEPETEVRSDESGEPRPGLISVTNQEPVSDAGSSADNKSFICSECGKAFCGEENLKVHMRTHAGEKPFSCSFCEKGFTQKGYLTNHTTEHMDEKRFLYCVCGKRFAWRYNLKNHKCVGEMSQIPPSQREENRAAEPPAGGSSELQTEVSADGCNETRGSQSRLNSPRNNQAPEGDAAERPFSCSQCGKRFRRKKNLQEHTRIHTGEKPYGCSVCMKYFSCSGSLRKHLRIHTGEKPFSCSVCGNRFTESGHLKVHMRTHTGEKPFSCSVCGNRFTESGHLKVHMRTHTGEKPFSCSVCGKSFTWRQSFNNHMKYHTETTRDTS
ncbi:uncharacterized protein LOC121619952 [Chelmon rostratus]|uniref:uncharacterized protein LOC121619952 n=1 Tax=Chelmon rostratus TaxID=109905 RepID=UPI001BE5FB8F|nr:uncharacterized protein LOC121619952 [Chelmon rostratus]